MFGLFIQTLTPEPRASIRVVAGDGARWIDSCVQEWCPNDERAPAVFHIVNWTSDAPDNPRKQQKAHIFEWFLRRCRSEIVATAESGVSRNLGERENMADNAN